MAEVSYIDKLEQASGDFKGGYLADEKTHLEVIAGEADIIVSPDHQGDGNELKRELQSRHASMLAIGGAIGTGLVIGSGVGLARGGPVSGSRFLDGWAFRSADLRYGGIRSLHRLLLYGLDLLRHDVWTRRGQSRKALADSIEIPNRKRHYARFEPRWQLFYVGHGPDRVIVKCLIFLLTIQLTNEVSLDTLLAL
jgi:hypothetical protein